MVRTKNLVLAMTTLLWGAWLVLASYSSHDAVVFGRWSKRLFALIVGYSAILIPLTSGVVWILLKRDSTRFNQMTAWIRSNAFRQFTALLFPPVLWLIVGFALILTGPSAELADRLLLTMFALMGAIFFWECLVLLGDRKPQEQKPLILRSLAIFSGFFAAFLIVELVGSVGEIEPVAAWNLNPPNLSRHWKTDEFDTLVTTNSQGLRESHFIEREHPQVFRIVVIGDSVTFGQGVNDEETYSRLLQHQLQERYGWKNCQVVNVSRRGAGPGEYLQYLHLALEKLKPDLIVLGYYTLNDCPVRQPYVPRTPKELEKLWNDILRESQPHPLLHSFCCRLLFRKAIRPLARSWNTARVDGVPGVPDVLFGTPNELGLLLDSSLTKAEQNRLTYLRDQGWIERGLNREINPAPLVAAIQRPERLINSMYLREETRAALVNEWNLCERILLEMSKVAETHNVPFWMLIIPHPYQVDPAAVEQLKDWNVVTTPEMLTSRVQNDLVVAFCRDNHIFAIDPLAKFRMQTDQGQQLFYPIDSHCTPTGHRLLADVLAKHLVESQFNPSAKTRD